MKATPVDRSRASVEDRFWRHVRKSDGCWEWIGALNQHGYGHFSLRQGVHWRASRFSWTLHIGPIPDGLFVLHRCDNPPCVRPDHLFLGTQADNIRDMVAKDRHPRASWHAIGERNNHARLTEPQVVEIRRRHAAGERTLRLAREYGVHRDTIGRITRGIRWRNVA